jgi:[NiFe] hydrogenase diaphorase moiety large subunit
VYDLPLGISVAALLTQVGGENAKGVQIGGASGTLIPPSEFGRNIGYEDIATGGSIFVIGPSRDMLDVAENFLEFFIDESCGQCTPCREGNEQLRKGIEKLRHGRCSTRELRELVKLGETMQIASKCGLGQSSPNAFLSIIRHYQNELMARPSTERSL